MSESGTATQDGTHRIDKLLDAIELVQEERPGEARVLLRELIREDSDFEHAWLWMSVAVETLDQSTLCLDNVLRVNPANRHAAGALYRIREPEIKMQKQRNRMLLLRDIAFLSMWMFIIVLLPVMATLIMEGMIVTGG